MSEVIACAVPVGMLRPGSPVIPPPALFKDWTLGADPPAVVITPSRRDRTLIAVEGQSAWPLTSGLMMDLTDATGRAHAAWWIAERVGIIGNVTPVLAVSVPMGVIWTCLPWPAWLIQTWQCQVDDDHHRRFVQPGRGKLHGDVEVPALARLDPEDDTRLPDGSRRVDALALRSVVEHLIAQMEQTP